MRATARVFEVDPNTVLPWLVEAAEHLRAFSCDFLCDVHVKQLQLDELYAVLRDVKNGALSASEASSTWPANSHHLDGLGEVHNIYPHSPGARPISGSFVSTSRAIPAKGLVSPTRPAGQGWRLIWYVVNACRRPGRPHPASRRDSQATSDTMSERTLCHGSGQVVRALKCPGPRHGINGLSPPSLVAVHRRVTAPSLGSALLACGPCSGDVSRSCLSGMGFAVATNNRVTERHCTASVEM